MGEIEVELPDGRIIKVPADASDDIIEMIAKREMMKTQVGQQPQGLEKSPGLGSVASLLGFKTATPQAGDQFDHALLSGLSELAPFAPLVAELAMTRGGSIGHLLDAFKGGVSKGYNQRPTIPEAFMSGFRKGFNPPAEQPVLKMPAGAKADYSAWVRTQDARFPEKGVPALLQDLAGSLAKDAAKRVQRKEPKK